MSPGTSADPFWYPVSKTENILYSISVPIPEFQERTCVLHHQQTSGKLAQAPKLKNASRTFHESSPLNSVSVGNVTRSKKQSMYKILKGNKKKNIPGHKGLICRPTAAGMIRNSNPTEGVNSVSINRNSRLVNRSDLFTCAPESGNIVTMNTGRGSGRRLQCPERRTQHQRITALLYISWIASL